jgi:hypothetical protein
MKSEKYKLTVSISIASSRKYGSSASIAFAYTLGIEVEAATIDIAKAVS